MPHSSAPLDLSLTIRSNDDLGAGHFLLTLAPGNGQPELPAWEAGQFVMLTLGQPPGADDPLLRRPFSIFNRFGSPGGIIQIFYKVLGRGTAILSAAKPGQILRGLAPLGNGFAPERPPGSRLLLVAGGIGSASLHPLALQEHEAGGSPTILYGCRSEADMAGIRPSIDAGLETRVCTDDGSVGRRGFVSDLLDEFLSNEEPGAGPWVVCACGPTAMMKATSAVADRHGVRCYLSLESPMACGFGVCVGCVVGIKDTPASPLVYRRICVDGPVFDAAQVCW